MIENMFSLVGRTALVTGGGKGIGAMITQGLIESGAKVYISSRSADDCINFASKMNELGKGQCLALPADLSKIENIEVLAENFAEKEEKLDILINNSGTSWGASIDEFPEKGWDKVMDLNVKGVFFLTQKLLPQLRKAGTHETPANVVMISSIAAVSSESISAYSYGPSKAAVAQLGKILARDLAKDHITVNSIGPGFFESNMTRHFDKDMMAKMNPLKRVGRPEDIAGLVIYMCSRAGSYMTGAYIPLDGGQLIG